MALKEKYMVKQVLGNTDLELEAKSGESLLIKDILIYNPLTNYITCKIEKTTVGYFRAGGTLGSHLPFIVGRSQHAHDITTGSTTPADQTSFADLENAGGTNVGSKVLGGLAKDTTYRRAMNLASIPSVVQKSILGLLTQLGLFKGFPVGEGETLLITGAKQSGAIQLVKYEIHDAGDFTPESENGSASKKYLFLNYGNTGANINKTGDSLFNTAQSPAEFPDFPYDKTVPAKFIVRLLGILASDFAPKENDGTDYCYTDYLKLVKGRVTLFDEDKNGILLYSGISTALGNIDMVGEGQSLIGNYSDVDMRLPLIFPTPLEFLEGEELNVYLTTTQGSSGKNIATDEHEIALIQEVEKIA